MNIYVGIPNCPYVSSTNILSSIHLNKKPHTDSYKQCLYNSGDKENSATSVNTSVERQNTQDTVCCDKCWTKNSLNHKHV